LTFVATPPPKSPVFPLSHRTRPDGHRQPTGAACSDAVAPRFQTDCLYLIVKAPDPWRSELKSMAVATAGSDAIMPRNRMEEHSIAEPEPARSRRALLKPPSIHERFRLWVHRPQLEPASTSRPFARQMYPAPYHPEEAPCRSPGRALRNSVSPLLIDRSRRVRQPGPPPPSPRQKFQGAKTI